MEYLSAKILGVNGGHLITFRMFLQALRDYGEACSKAGLRLERLWVSWKALGHKSPPDTSKRRLVCALFPVLVSSQPPSSLSILFFFFCLYIPPVIYLSIYLYPRDTGYNCVLVSRHSVTDMKVQFLLCVVWVSLLIQTSDLGQLWAAITLPDVRSTLGDWLKSQKANHHNFYTLAEPYVCGCMEPIKWGEEGGWQLWH